MESSSLDLFREICLTNGIDAESADAPINAEVIQLFFTGIPRMISMIKFSLLKELQIIGQEVRVIEYLETCPNLTKLWICECKLTQISGMSTCTHLQELFLYQNIISKIENLENLSKLKKLWLNDNLITYLQGLENLRELTEINLSGNKIETIGCKLEQNKQLETFYISGNQLYNSFDLFHLARLPKLGHIWLNDSAYPDNPLCSNSNYLLLLLYMMPRIKTIDGIKVTSKLIQSTITNALSQKKRFYFMKTMAKKATVHKSLDKVMKTQQRILSEIDNQLYRLNKTLNYLTVSPLTTLNKAQDTLANHEDANRENAIKNRISLWVNKRYQVTHRYQLVKRHIEETYSVTEALLESELEQCGNVSIKEGDYETPWFKICSDLLNSRFCIGNSSKGALIGFNVRSVFRISHKLLGLRYEETINSSFADDFTYTFSNKGAQPTQDYLLLSYYSDGLGSPEKLISLITEGFSHFEKKPIHLSNTLNIADSMRIHEIEMNTKPINEFWPQTFSRIILVRSQANLFQGPDLISDSHSNGFYVLSGNLCNGTYCRHEHRDYYVFASSLLLPEFIIDIEYITKQAITCFFYRTIYEKENISDELTEFIDKSSIELDEELILPLPLTSNAEQVTELNEAILTNLLCCSKKQLNKQTSLKIHDLVLKQLVGISLLSNLSHLTASFCSLTKLVDLDGLPLKYLNVSYNYLTSLKGLSKSVSLHTLNIGWNRCTQLQKTLNFLSEHAPYLHEVWLIGNPWCKPQKMIKRALNSLSFLCRFDGVTIVDLKKRSIFNGEIPIAAKNSHLIKGIIKVADIQEGGRTLTNALVHPNLTLKPIATYLMDRQISTFGKHIDCVNSSIFTGITSLSIENQHLTKLSNLERLVNLHYASFQDNEITKITGLSSCDELEELSLERNCISRIENISHLTKLHSLHLSDNHISSLKGAYLERLKDLQRICLGYNRIESLEGIQQCSSLKEVYLGNNLISDIRSIFILKQLPELTILELYGTPLEVSSDHYRFKIIHHLKSLKALDGIMVTNAEVTTGKEMFGGRMTCEFLMSRLGHDQFADLVQLDMIGVGLKSVDLFPLERFINLRSLNLDNNHLASFSGLIFLENLQALCLNQNRIECLFPRNTGDSFACGSVTMLAALDERRHSIKQIMPRLEVLHLAQNGIKSLQPLQLHRIPTLKALFLQDNSLVSVDGLEGLHQLRELVLDRNRIKKLSETSFLYNWSLQEIHLEENRLRDLHHLGHLERLQRLYVGFNKLTDLNELEESLGRLRSLVEISLPDNPVARRGQHRLVLVYNLPQLKHIDGQLVLDEERERAAAFYAEQQYHTLLAEQNGMLVTAKPAVGLGLPTGAASIAATVSGPFPSTLSEVLLTSSGNSLPSLTPYRSTCSTASTSLLEAAVVATSVSPNVLSSSGGPCVGIAGSLSTIPIPHRARQRNLPAVKLCNFSSMSPSISAPAHLTYPSSHTTTTSISSITTSPNMPKCITEALEATVTDTIDAACSQILSNTNLGFNHSLVTSKNSTSTTDLSSNIVEIPAPNLHPVAHHSACIKRPPSAGRMLIAAGSYGLGLGGVGETVAADCGAFSAGDSAGLATNPAGGMMKSASIVDNRSGQRLIRLPTGSGTGPSLSITPQNFITIGPLPGTSTHSTLMLVNRHLDPVTDVGQLARCPSNLEGLTKWTGGQVKR